MPSGVVHLLTSMEYFESGQCLNLRCRQALSTFPNTVFAPVLFLHVSTLDAVRHCPLKEDKAVVTHELMSQP